VVTSSCAKVVRVDESAATVVSSGLAVDSTLDVMLGVVNSVGVCASVDCVVGSSDDSDGTAVETNAEVNCGDVGGDVVRASDDAPVVAASVDESPVVTGAEVTVITLVSEAEVTSSVVTTATVVSAAVVDAADSAVVSVDGVTSVVGGCWELETSGVLSLECGVELSVGDVVGSGTYVVLCSTDTVVSASVVTLSVVGI
jgi:hypothetical protein